MDSLFLGIIGQLIIACAYNLIIRRERTFRFRPESLRGTSVGRKFKAERFLVCRGGI